MIRFLLRRWALLGAIALMLGIPGAFIIAATSVDLTALPDPLDPVTDANGEWILFEHVSGDDLAIRTR